MALTRLRQFADTQASVTPYEPGGGTAMSGSSSSLVMEARHYLGGNPTGRGSLWCARFMNMVLEHTGHHGTGSDMASSFASYGQRISGPQVGAIAVMGRRGGGHVGIITGIDSRRQPDHDLRQQRQPRPRSAGLARPDLRLRDAELSCHCEKRRPAVASYAICGRLWSSPKPLRVGGSNRALSAAVDCSAALATTR